MCVCHLYDSRIGVTFLFAFSLKKPKQNNPSFRKKSKFYHVLKYVPVQVFREHKIGYTCICIYVCVNIGMFGYFCVCRPLPLPHCVCVVSNRHILCLAKTIKLRGPVFLLSDLFSKPKVKNSENKFEQPSAQYFRFILTSYSMPFVI